MENKEGRLHIRKDEKNISFVSMRNKRDITEGQLVCHGRENMDRSKWYKFCGYKE